MFENENLVTEVTENVENTTEETPKTYTEAEFNAKLDEVLGKKIARKEAKIRKEYVSLARLTYPYSFNKNSRLRRVISTRYSPTRHASCAALQMRIISPTKYHIA